MTPARTPKRRAEQPMLVTEALQHLRDRAMVMRGKEPRVWLRWNRADVEAVETLHAAITSKVEPTNEETKTMEIEITPFTIVVEASGPEEAREIAAEMKTLVEAAARRARTTRNGTRRDRMLSKIRRVDLLVEPVAA